MQINPKEVIEKGIIKDIQNLNKQVQQNGIDLTVSGIVSIRPFEFELIEFNETFDMKECFGLLWLRSSYARMGVILTCGIFDSGFSGKGAVGLYNGGTKAVFIDSDTRVCQMVVFKGNPSSLYNGYYKDNPDTESKLDKGLNNNICPVCGGSGVTTYEDGCHIHKETCWNCRGNNE